MASEHIEQRKERKRKRVFLNMYVCLDYNGCFSFCSLVNNNDLCFIRDERSKMSHLELITHSAGRNHDRDLKSC